MFFGGGRRGPSGPRKGEDIRHPLKVSKACLGGLCASVPSTGLSVSSSGHKLTPPSQSIPHHIASLPP